MRILLIHSEYLHRGGEDSVLLQEYDLLASAHEVKTIIYKNRSGLRGALQFLFSIYNFHIATNIRNEIKLYKPDVVHFHNWHFATGPAAIRAAQRENVPIIMTLHNFRLLCPSATLLLGGKIFTDSLHSSFPWKAVFGRVYRMSYLQTFWLAFVVWYHKKIGTWGMVTRYIVLTQFAKELFSSSTLGLDENYFSVKPNFVEKSVNEYVKREDHFLYVGRLSLEKGIMLLIDVFRNTESILYIAGDGPLQNELSKIVSEMPNIKLLGNLSKEEVRAEMQRCTALIFPSLWFEGMPMTIIEAFAVGTPIIASNLGAMSSMITHDKNGLHFDPNDLKDLDRQIFKWNNLSVSQKHVYSEYAEAAFYDNYTSKSNLDQLVDIYVGAKSKKMSIDN